MILPLSRPSRTRTFTCVASPAMPVLPTISTTSAGMLSSSAIDGSSLLQGADLRREVVQEGFRLACVEDRHGGRRLAEPRRDAELLLARDVRVRDALLLA